MKKMLLFCCLIAFSSCAYGQTKKKSITDSSKIKAKIDSSINFIEEIEKKTPRFISDKSVNSISQSQLFNEVTPSGYDLLNTNLSFVDKDQTQKIGFSPFRLSGSYKGALSNLKINVVNKSGNLTSGFSLGYDNTDKETKRVHRIFDSWKEKVNKHLSKPPQLGIDESNDDYAKRTKAYDEELKELISDFYYDGRRLNHIFKYSAGYNAQFFAVLKSKSPNGNFDSLNYHAFKGHNFFINASYGWNNGCFTVDGAINYFNKRKSADSLQTRNNYIGYSLSVSKRIVTLIGKDELPNRDFYKKDRFVPSIYLGFAFDVSDYEGTNYKYAENNAKSIKVYTPFVDISVSPTIQFRLAFPIKNISEFDKKTNGETVSTVLSLNYKII